GSSTGTLVVYWGGPTTRRQASRAVDTASRLLDDPDFPEAEDEGLAWHELARALEPFEDYVADYVEQTPDADIGTRYRDEYVVAVEGAERWLNANGLAGTARVERGVWSKGPRVSVTITR
ncbi:MAG: hypothetical protein R3324_15675, partial [Halobacteriales archaeon]|nr:hypothetical protein [Halobacteriales archaeon]